jgi:hypothetical protein
LKLLESHRRLMMTVVAQKQQLQLGGLLCQDRLGEQ